MNARDRIGCALVVTAVLALAPSLAAETVIVQVANFAFSPGNVTIQEGDVVRWQWISGSHTTTSGTSCTPDGLWNVSLNSSNQSFERTFNDAGAFPYFCIPHCLSDMTGNVTVETGTGVLEGDAAISLPGRFAIHQNFPNPFNASTVIRYSLERDATVRLQVFDILGRRVATVVDEDKPIGVHEAAWDGTDDQGRAVASGIYVYRLHVGDDVLSRKMTLLK